MLNTVLLNLADLHCNCERSRQAGVFEAFCRELTCFVGKHPEWKPDFVVLPGDLMESYEEENRKYTLKFLTNIKNICKLTFGEFVIVPGNHDKGYRGFSDLFYQFLEKHCSTELVGLLEDRRYREEPEELKDYLCRFFLKTKDMEKTDFKKLLVLLRVDEKKYPVFRKIQESIKVSGNDLLHDAKSQLLKDLKAEAKRSSEVVNEFLNGTDDKGSSGFYELQKKCFSDYSDFVKGLSGYADKDGPGCMRTIGCLSDESTRCLVGYKVCDDEKIVFLMLNTEWQTMLSQFGGTRELRLGRRIVLELTDEIMRNYPHYTIVTVMHRPPYALEWGEKNVKNTCLFNSYTRLMNVSDVILSGHNHQLKHFYPEYLWNQTQHFQLGSLACNPDQGEDVYPYAASLLRINSLQGEVELLCVVADTDRADGNQWKMRFDLPESRIYPMKGAKVLGSDSRVQSLSRREAVEILRIKRDRKDSGLQEALRREALRVIMNRFYRNWDIRYDEWSCPHGEEWKYNLGEWIYNDGKENDGSGGWQYTGTSEDAGGRPPKIMSLDCFVKKLMKLPVGVAAVDSLDTFLRKQSGDVAGSDFFTGEAGDEHCHLIIYSLFEKDLDVLLNIRHAMLLSNRLLDTTVTTVMLLN